MVYEQALLQAIRAQFDRQREELLAGLDRNPRGKSFKTKDYITSLMDWAEMDEALKAAIAPYLYQVIIEVGREAMIDIGAEPSEYDPFTPAIRRYQDERATKIAVDVNDETEKQLRATLTEAITAGESNYQIRARIEHVLGVASTMRADLIASTEVARAQSFADVSAWSQSGRVQGKEWYTAKDERVCPICNDMDGKVIGLEENFFDKGDVQIAEGTNRNGGKKVQTFKHDYDDVPGAPLHPRCRCTLLPVRIA